MGKLKILDLWTHPDEPFYKFWEKHMNYDRFQISRAGTEPEEEICKQVKDADILLTDPFHQRPVTTKILKAAEKLKLIQCYTIGFDARASVFIRVYFNIYIRLTLDPSSFISVGITLALELRKFIFGYIDVRKSKEKYLSAIGDEALLIDESWSKLITFNDSVMELLNSIKDYPTVNQLYDFLQHCAESMRIYSELINSYINYSVAVKQFSVNEDLMDKLRKYKGMLYDYVQRVSETVTDENTIVIGGNFHRFIKAHQKEIFPKISKKESEKIHAEAQQFMDLIKRKILPNIIKQKPRFLFREKRIKIIFSEPYTKMMDDREKIKLTIPEDEIRELFQETISPILIVFEELKSIEDAIPKRKRLPRSRRRR